MLESSGAGPQVHFVRSPPADGGRYGLAGVNPISSIYANIIEPDRNLKYSYDQFLADNQKSDSLSPSCTSALHSTVEAADTTWGKDRSVFVNGEKHIDNDKESEARTACADPLKNNEDRAIGLYNEINRLDKLGNGSSSKDAIDLMNQRNSVLAQGALDSKSDLHKTCQAVWCVNPFIKRSQESLKVFQETSAIDKKFAEQSHSLQKQVDHLFQDSDGDCVNDNGAGAFGRGPKAEGPRHD